jgi:hypothetical protein
LYSSGWPDVFAAAKADKFYDESGILKVNEAIRQQCCIP